MSVRCETSTAAPAKPAEGKRHASCESILVVDGDAGARHVLDELLNGEGYRAVCAETGAEAIACLQAQSVQVLITDVQLPDMDGIALIQRAFEIDARILGVVATGHGRIDLAVEAMKAGASDILTKPFQAQLVLAAVGRLVELHRLRQENSVLKHGIVKAGAVRIRSVALADFSRGDRGGVSDGLTEFERGLAEGERRAQEREAALRRREHALLANAVQRLEETIANVRATVEEEVCALAFAIAAKIVRQVVEERRDLVVEQVRAALARVKDSGSVRLRVHPSDAPLLESAREALAGVFDGPVTLVVEADPRVAPGGCLVQTPTRLVDAALETQLARLGEALRDRH
ncbi:MAG: response regulator [Nitrospirota bacterium]